jgi:hypothetical protein
VPLQQIPNTPTIEANLYGATVADLTAAADALVAKIAPGATTSVEWVTATAVQTAGQGAPTAQQRWELRATARIRLMQNVP